MKTTRQLPLLAVSFALAAMGGWFAARQGDQPASAAELVPAKSADRKHPARSAREIPPEVAARLAPLRAAKTTDERLRAMTLLAQSLPVSDLAAWYEAGWIPRRETVESLQFYHITGQRWVAQDGEGMLRFHFAKDRSRAGDVSQDWGRLDPTAAFKFLDGLKDPKDFALVAGPLSWGAAYGDPQQALARVLHCQAADQIRAGGENGYLRNSGEAEGMIDVLARSAPDLLKQEAAGWPENLRRRALNEITRGLLAKDFDAGVAKLAGEADGLEQFLGATCWELNEKYAASADKLPEGWLPALLNKSNKLAELDPDRWFAADYAGMGITEEKARGLRATAARVLLYRSPERLPELLAADLDPRSRDYLIVTSLRQLYGTDPAKAAELRDQIGLSADMDGLWGKALAEAPSNGPPKYLDSPSQLGEITSWSRDDKDRAVVKMQAWDEGQIQQSLKAFETLPDGDRHSIAEMLSGLKGEPAPMPLRAEGIRYLITEQGDTVLPDDQNFRYFCEFASKWGGDEPAAAARWVESLPTGEKRLWMAKNVSASWANYNPQAAAKWVDSLGLKEQLQGLGKGKSEE